MNVPSKKRFSFRPAAILRYIVQHPWQVILLHLAITLIFASQLPNLRFKTSIYDMAIEDLPETRQYEAFKKIFGSEEIILVVAKAEDIFDPNTFSTLEKLSDSLAKIEGVRRVISLPEVRRSIDLGKELTPARFRSVIGPVKLFRRNLFSKDNKKTAICLILKDVQDKSPVIASVQDTIEKFQLPLYQIGMPIVAEALATFTKKDFFHLPPITFVVIAFVLFAFMRNLRGILIPAGSVLMALVWTFGLISWTGTPLSMLTMIVPVFLIAVGTAYCIIVCTYFRNTLIQQKNNCPLLKWQSRSFRNLDFQLS